MATGMAVPTSAGVPLGLGVGLVAEYTLSKRTCLIANYASWDATIGAVARNNETNLLLSHTF